MKTIDEIDEIDMTCPQCGRPADYIENGRPLRCIECLKFDDEINQDDDWRE
jgi:Zn finger protein HypA/HybF involved in hydrogenase expression